MQTELSTSVVNPEQLDNDDFSAYDALYLGDFSCPHYRANFSAHPELVVDAVAALKAAGKRTYLRVYAVPSNVDLPAVRRVLEAAQTSGVDALEVHNLGVLRMLREIGNTLPVHLGVFGNLYTHETARVLRDYGVERVYPNPELSLDEIAYIAREAPVDVLVPVHGKIPLVVSETCFILEHVEGCTERCDEICQSEYWLHRTKGDWTLKDTGRMTLSGKDLCMLEHVPDLLGRGLGLLHVQNLGERAGYAGQVGPLYRAALDAALAGKQATGLADAVAELAGLASVGLCNGYYFGSAGQRYVGELAA